MATRSRLAEVPAAVAGIRAVSRAPLRWPAVPDPFVRVVVLHHRSPELTARCLRHLAAVDWPRDRLDLVVVDNGSGDDMTGLVATNPGARVVHSPNNLGYAAGCNLGMGDLDGIDAVALVNNDAYVEPDWLHALADVLAGEPTLAAVTPRVLFDERYVTIALQSPARSRSWIDRRAVGVTVHRVRVGGTDVFDRSRRAAGFWGSEPGDRGRWLDRTDGDARLLVPAPAGRPAGLVEVLVSGRSGEMLQLSGPLGEKAEAALDAEPRWVGLTVEAKPIDVINNVGTFTTADLYGVDRGIHEPADGRYREDEPVESWSGTAPLLSAAHLRAVGRFDERLFAYYEDLDLALRARAAGWRHRYVAGAVVRHTHAATSGLQSSDFTYLNERNRLLLVAWHRGRLAVCRASARHLVATGGYARRDLLARVAEGRRPWLGQLVPRLRAVVAAQANQSRGRDASGSRTAPR